METSWAASLNLQLRDSFHNGITRPLPWRLQQLDAIATLLRVHEADINLALHQDLGKSAFECFCTEVGIILNSIVTIKKNLKNWMKPQKVSIPLVLQPASGAIIAEPFGVILIFSTWNFPLILALEPLIGAIAAGNAAVLKCSEVAPSVSTLLATLIPQYLDKRAIKVVEGGIPESQELLRQRWDKIFYTGNGNVGKIVMEAAAKHLTPVTLELGGKSPVILDSGIDLKVATRRIASGKWGINSGQACVAPDYILVGGKNAERLVDALVATLEEFFGKDVEKCPDLTRIVNKRHFSRLTSCLTESGVAKSIVYGGKYSEEKLFFEPTILLDPPLDSTVMNEEVFGPILPIITVGSMNEAINFVSSRDKPLTLYLFTNDENLKARVVNETSSGSVVVNDAVIQVGVDVLPFGGVGESGMGAYHGKYSFENFSHKKPVMYRSLWGDVAVRYPPYETSVKQSIVKHIVRFDYLGLILTLLGLKR